MKNVKIVLALMVLFSSFTLAQTSILYMTFTDMTGDNYQNGYLYQNDNLSVRFIKQVNLTGHEAVTMGACRNFDLYIEPPQKAGIKNVESNLMLDLLFHNFTYLIVIIAITLIFITYIGYKVIKK